MNMENITQLVRIYNTLLTVKTSGKDTVTMGRCLEALETLILKLDETPEIINEGG